MVERSFLKIKLDDVMVLCHGSNDWMIDLYTLILCACQPLVAIPTDGTCCRPTSERAVNWVENPVMDGQKVIS